MISFKEWRLGQLSLSARLIIRNPFVVIVSTIACVHSRAYTCKLLDSGSCTMHLFQAFSNYVVAPHRSLHRMAVLMNSRKWHSCGFFVTLLRGHSKWIVWEVIMDRGECSWEEMETLGWGCKLKSFPSRLVSLP